MGLFYHNIIKELEELEKDLTRFQIVASNFLHGSHGFSGSFHKLDDVRIAADRKLLDEFLKLKSLYRIDKKMGRMVRRDLVKDFKHEGLDTSELRTFSVFFNRFLEYANMDMNLFEGFTKGINKNFIVSMQAKL
ncbi:hypothetical protein CMO89_01550 [Candidatus Woesearchaeota archaeon]|nr:hypothetical protein [Candidatus Woesearchaeota archaeon]|tara:strand:- start:8484 stop:8885 length:402 start_codon:yes stop_codon:yes gene_type:complete